MVFKIVWLSPSLSQETKLYHCVPSIQKVWSVIKPRKKSEGLLGVNLSIRCNHIIILKLYVAYRTKSGRLRCVLCLRLNIRTCSSILLLFHGERPFFYYFASCLGVASHKKYEIFNISHCCWNMLKSLLSFLISNKKSILIIVTKYKSHNRNICS